MKNSSPKLAFVDVWWLYGLAAIAYGLATGIAQHTSTGLIVLIVWSTTLRGVER